MLHTRTLLALAVATGLSWASAAQADTTTGRVVAKDLSAGTISIETEDGQRVEFELEDSTRFEGRGDKARLEDLEVGDRVEVSTTGSGDRVERRAVAVHVQDEAGFPAEGDGARSQTFQQEREADVDTEGEMRTASARDSGRRLPDTASPIPLLAVLGAGAVALGALSRRMRR